MRTLTFLSLLLVGSSAFRVDFSDEASKEKPIQKVIRLLNEMQAQLQKEADADEDMMDKLGCWCDTNEKEKTKALAINNQRVQDLTSAVEEYTAKSAQLKVDLENLDKQVATTSKSLDEATSIRAKDSQEFQDTEKDYIQNVGSLKGAILTLGKVHGESLSQQALVQVKQLLKHHMKNYHHIFAQALSASQHKVVVSLIQQPMDADVQKAFLQEEGQAPQSGAIFGIMKQMKESMETNMASAQKDEESAKSDYDDMKSSKTAELNAAKELIDSKKVELADTDSKNAQAKEDLEDTNATIEADTKFLAALKDKCSNASADYAARSKVRNEELQACSETIGILTDDDAKDLMNFMQVSKRTSGTTRDRAVRFVQAAAKRLHQPKLAAVAISMRNDVFAKVKENIDGMVAALKKTQADEVKQRDFCVKDFHKTEMTTAEKTNQKQDLNQLLADLSTSNGELAEEIKQLTAEVAQTQVDMKVASENRLSQSKEFQQTVTDQRATQAILKKAIDRLKSFYSKKSFLQTGATHAQSQPGYKKNSGAASIMTMIENIIEESKEEEKDAIKSENDSQAAYEALIEDSNEAIATMQKSIVNKQEELGKVDMKTATASSDLQKTEEELLKLAAYTLSLHQSCDFTVKFFDVRQQKRAEEIEALQQAKAIFSGANFGF